MKLGVFLLALVLIYPVYALQVDINGITNSKLYSNISYLWNYSIPSCPQGTNVIYSKPVVVNDSIYLNAAYSLSALYLNGTEKWHSTCYERWWMGNPVIKDDIVYTQNWVGTFAFNATNGSIIWEIKLNEGGGNNWGSPDIKTNVDFTPFLENDLLWSGGGYSNGERTTYVINITNNTMIWNNTIRANESSAPLIVNNRAFIAYRRDKALLVSYNSTTFEELWNITLDGNIAETFMSYSNGRIIIGTSYDWNLGCEGNQTLYAINENNGNIVRNYTIEKCFTFAGTKPVIYNGMVFVNPTNFTGDFHRIYIFNENNGNLILKSGVREGTTWTSLMVIANNKLVYGTSSGTNGTIYVFDSNLNKIWSYNFKTRGFQAGAFIYNKIIFMPSDDEKIYGFNSSDLNKPSISLINYSIDLLNKKVTILSNVSDIDELDVNSVTVNVHWDNGTIVKQFTLYDDGTNGDSVINDSIFTYVWNITKIKQGTYFADINASDLSGNSKLIENALAIPYTTTATGSYTNTSIELTSNQTLLIESKSDINTSLEMSSNGNTSGTINMIGYNSNPGLTGIFGATDLNKFIEIEATDSIDGNLSWAMIKVYYTDADLSSRGITNESSLRLYYWNTTNNTWVIYNSPNGGVNITGNYIWANTTHFTVFGAFGEEDASSSTTSNTGGGGGGITINEEGNTTNITILNPVPITTIVPSTEIKTNKTNKTEEGLAAITGAATIGNLNNMGRATITASILLILILSYMILRSRTLRRFWIRVRLKWMLKV